MTKKAISYAVIRGKVIDTDLIEFGGRNGDLKFYAPDPQKIVGQLPLGSPSKLDDLYQLSLKDILDYMEELGKRLNFQKNAYMQEACELSYLTAPATAPIIRGFYQNLPAMFDRERITRWLDMSVGIPYIEGWVDHEINGSTVSIRAYGSRSLHIVAGNGPVVGALSVLRSAVTRGDIIVKVPSNDPFTTGAMARTMIDFAPDHPITKHVSVAYWRGGDESVEQKLYQPQHIEKIVAWGGLASVKHVTKYIQPGLELISLDPKRSASIVGGDALKTDALIRETASRIAVDVGAVNQSACSSCRVVYVLSGTDQAGIDKVVKLGKLAYEAMMRLPSELSTKPKRYNPQLKSEVDALRMNDEWYDVIGGQDGEGAVIVSHTSDPVEFAESLDDRTVNLVPVDTLEEVLGAVDSYTQTVGVFPDDLMPLIRHKAALHGGQRFVSLGYAFNGPGLVGPQDGIEPLRRMCKWIVSEKPHANVRPLWEMAEGETALVA